VARRRFLARPASVRSRLVAVFAVGSTILLVMTGALLYVGFNHQLDNAIEQALRDRAADIELDLKEGSQQIRPGEPFVVLLETNGRVIDSTVTGLRRTPVLTARDLARAQEREVVVERRRITGLGDRGKLLARPEKLADGRTIVLVVGESLDTVSRASQRLGILLAVASPVLIGVIVGCGWVLVGAALRPVRRMTTEAGSISLRESGQRLAQPPGDDEIALLGNTLNAMLDRIEGSLAHERAFVDDASHELRTPLSILRGELELASTAPDDRAGMERALASALQEADRLSRLTDDLLVLARSDRGHLEPRLEPVDLVESARRPAQRHPEATVEVAVSGEPVWVSADPDLLERVLGNLIDNACRHATARVQVSVDADDGAGRLMVADDGPGFPPEFLPVAFDRFTRADAVRGRDQGGSGLGLAIVASLVRGQGGRVGLGNGEPLGGGRVEVWLPLAGAQPAVARQADG
jgi:signal transduction histidine kinase